MLFNFQEFIEVSRVNKEKWEFLKKYEEKVWPIKWDIKDQPWFIEYVSKFKKLQYLVPQKLLHDFDWWILMQLVVSSFSSVYEYKKFVTKKWIEWYNLYITVSNGEKSITKTVLELYPKQIERLFEIYIDEQMNLHLLKFWKEEEKSDIEWERMMKLNKWNTIIDNLDNEEIKKKVEEEKKDKLDDLYSQL